MVKNSSILTVSMPKEYSEFLDTHDFSPSELLQRAIEEQMGLWKRYHTEIGKMDAANQQLLNMQQRLFEFIEEIGHTDHFLKWMGERNHAVVA
jgi:hypothetical protein